MDQQGDKNIFPFHVLSTQERSIVDKKGGGEKKNLYCNKAPIVHYEKFTCIKAYWRGAAVFSERETGYYGSLEDGGLFEDSCRLMRGHLCVHKIEDFNFVAFPRRVGNDHH